MTKRRRSRKNSGRLRQRPRRNSYWKRLEFRSIDRQRDTIWLKEVSHSTAAILQSTVWLSIRSKAYESQRASHSGQKKKGDGNREPTNSKSNSSSRPILCLRSIYKNEWLKDLPSTTTTRKVYKTARLKLIVFSRACATSRVLGNNRWKRVSLLYSLRTKLPLRPVNQRID